MRPEQSISKIQISSLNHDTLMHFSIGTPKTINFPFGTNGKLMVLSVPILKDTFFSLYEKGGLHNHLQ